MAEHILLDNAQIDRIIDRMSYEFLEENYQYGKAYFGGISGNGVLLAEIFRNRISSIVKDFKVIPFELSIDKKNPINSSQFNIDFPDLIEEPVTLVDDVINSGKTMYYALSAFSNYQMNTLQTMVLIKRSHLRFPVKSIITGVSLSTTLQENIEVSLQDREQKKAILV